MRRRQPVPRLWLMTDERMGDALWTALAALPRGAGVVFRHYATTDRAGLLGKVAKVARRRGLVLLGAGGLQGPDGAHNALSRGLVSRSAHSRRELIVAARTADLVFVSPIFPTRSHPGARALGATRLAAMIRGIDVPIIALGGMNARRMRALTRLGVHGWAGIDAWMPASPRGTTADPRRIT